MNKSFKKNIKIELVTVGILALAVLAVIVYNFKLAEAQQSSSAPISSSPVSINGTTYPFYYVNNSFSTSQGAGTFYKVGPDGTSLTSITPLSSGSFMAQDVGVYITKAPSGGNYAFAVIQPPSQQQSSESTTTYCYYQGNSNFGYIGLNVDKTFLAPGTGNTTSTISFVKSDRLPYNVVENGYCVVYSTTDSNINNHSYPISSIPTVVTKTTSTNSYSFDCFVNNNGQEVSICQPPKGSDGQPLGANNSKNTIPIYVRVFGGSAGGIQEIAPSQ